MSTEQFTGVLDIGDVKILSGLIDQQRELIIPLFRNQEVSSV